MVLGGETHHWIRRFGLICESRGSGSSFACVQKRAQRCCTAVCRSRRCGCQDSLLL